MPDKILIFGKDAWPYTRAARAAFAKEGRQVEYFNVVEVVGYLETMLKHSNGTRKVPVIVEGKTVTIGFEGDTWGIWFFRLEAESTKDWIFSIEDWIFKDRLQRINFKCYYQKIKGLTLGAGACAARAASKDTLFSKFNLSWV